MEVVAGGLGECGSGATDAHLAMADDDPAHDHADVGAPQLDGTFTQALAHCVGEPVEPGGREGPVA